MFAFALLGANPVLAEDCDDITAQVSAKTMILIVQGKACLRQTDPMSAECERAQESMSDPKLFDLIEQAAQCAQDGKVSRSALLISMDLNNEMLLVLSALSLKIGLAQRALQR